MKKWVFTMSVLFLWMALALSVTARGLVPEKALDPAATGFQPVGGYCIEGTNFLFTGDFAGVAYPVPVIGVHGFLFRGWVNYDGGRHYGTFRMEFNDPYEVNAWTIRHGTGDLESIYGTGYMVPEKYKGDRYKGMINIPFLNDNLR